MNNKWAVETSVARTRKKQKQIEKICRELKTFCQRCVITRTVYLTKLYNFSVNQRRGIQVATTFVQ